MLKIATYLNRLTTILLLLLVLFQPLSKVWMVVSFKINQKEIAKTLCVKKAIQKNTCQGKCQLKKQLAKAEEQENKQPSTTLKEKVETLYCNNNESSELLNKSESFERKLFHPYSRNFCSTDYLSDIFHPPESFLI